MDYTFSFNWDMAGYVLAMWGVVLSPSLLAIPWAWFTRIAQVRRILTRAIVITIATPFLGAGIYLLLSGICARGHLDQPLGECRIIPDGLVDPILMVATFPPMFAAAAMALYSAYLEIRRFMRPE